MSELQVGTEAWSKRNWNYLVEEELSVKPQIIEIIIFLIFICCFFKEGVKWCVISVTVTGLGFCRNELINFLFIKRDEYWIVMHIIQRNKAFGNRFIYIYIYYFNQIQAQIVCLYKMILSLRILIFYFIYNILVPPCVNICIQNPLSYAICVSENEKLTNRHRGP